MNFLSSFGFERETIFLIEPSCRVEKGKICFPFFNRYGVECSCETIKIDRTFRNAELGLYIVEPKVESIKLIILFFNSILDMLTHYNKTQKAFFDHAVLVVCSIKPSFSDIQYISERYNYCNKYMLIFENDLLGYCKEILITAYLSKIENVKLYLEEDKLSVTIHNIHHSFPPENFRFKRFLTHFKIPIRIVSKRITKPIGHNYDNYE